MARMHVIIVANLMSKATAPCMGRPVINVRVLIISKPFVIPRLQQPRERPALTGARSHSHCRDMHLLGASGHGKGGGKHHHHQKIPKKPPKQKAYEVTLKNSVLSEVTTTSGGERENGNVSHQKMVLSGSEEEGIYNRFSCFAVHSKMAQSTNTKS